MRHSQNIFVGAHSSMLVRIHIAFLLFGTVFEPLYIHHEKLASPSIAKQTLKHHEVSHSSLFQPTVSFTFDRILILLSISHKNHSEAHPFLIKEFSQRISHRWRVFFLVISGHVFGPRCAQEIGLKIDDSRNYCN